MARRPQTAEPGRRHPPGQARDQHTHPIPPPLAARAGLVGAGLIPDIDIVVQSYFSHQQASVKYMTIYTGVPCYILADLF